MTTTDTEGIAIAINAYVRTAAGDVEVRSTPEARSGTGPVRLDSDAPLTYARFFTAAQCQQLREACAGGGFPLSGNVPQADVRRTYDRDPNGPAAMVMGTVFELLERAATVHWHLSWMGLGNVQALRYRTGDAHPWHRDGNINQQLAWVGLVIYLSEPGVDYQGGELEIGGQLMTPSQGSIVFIPGHVEHRVRTVTAGERIVITAFAVCEPP